MLGDKKNSNSRLHAEEELRIRKDKIKAQLKSINILVMDDNVKGKSSTHKKKDANDTICSSKNMQVIYFDGEAPFSPSDTVVKDCAEASIINNFKMENKLSRIYFFGDEKYSGKNFQEIIFGHAYAECENKQKYLESVVKQPIESALSLLNMQMQKEGKLDEGFSFSMIKGLAVRKGKEVVPEVFLICDIRGDCFVGNDMGCSEFASSLFSELLPQAFVNMVSDREIVKGFGSKADRVKPIKDVDLSPLYIEAREAIAKSIDSAVLNVNDKNKTAKPVPSTNLHCFAGGPFGAVYCGGRTF